MRSGARPPDQSQDLPYPVVPVGSVGSCPSRSPIRENYTPIRASSNLVDLLTIAWPKERRCRLTQRCCFPGKGATSAPLPHEASSSHLRRPTSVGSRPDKPTRGCLCSHAILHDCRPALVSAKSAHLATTAFAIRTPRGGRLPCRRLHRPGRRSCASAMPRREASAAPRTRAIAIAQKEASGSRPATACDGRGSPASGDADALTSSSPTRLCCLHSLPRELVGTKQNSPVRSCARPLSSGFVIREVSG